MSEATTRKVEIDSEGDSRIIHPFNPIPPDSRSISQKASVTESDNRIYQKIGEIIVQPRERKMFLKSTILGATFMITNISLGTTIFTFAIRAKSFGLVWFIVACIIAGIINYWTIMRGVETSSKFRENDYSELTEKILGRKARVVLNIFIILYSYACMICFLSLIFPLFGRFIQDVVYNNKYDNYEDFEKMKWGKIYIKLPFFVGAIFCISLMCLIKDINKLNFSAYISVVAVIYTLLVVMIQCRDYYQYYKDIIYNEEDRNTHPNWINFENAFTKQLGFFKGMANLFFAYSCHPEIFPVFKGFKNQPGGLKKMRYGVLFATCLTTVLHIISIVCSYLTNPYSPEDLILYRKKRGNGKDLAMAISKLFVTLSLIFTIPGHYFGLRLSIVNSFTNGKITDKFNYIFTFASCIGCAILGALYDKILNYLIYIGGFISVFICYLNPILIYVYSSGKPVKYWKNLLEIILAIILCVIGVIAGFVTIIDDVKN